MAEHGALGAAGGAGGVQYRRQVDMPTGASGKSAGWDAASATSDPALPSSLRVSTSSAGRAACIFSRLLCAAMKSRGSASPTK